MDNEKEKEISRKTGADVDTERELKVLFEDFKTHVEDIADHAEQVHRIDFSARLKNGTGFSFTFNSEQWRRKFSPDTKQEPERYAPAAPFNAIVDIIGALLAIALMVVVAITLNRLPSFGIAGVLSVFVFTLFICYFVLAAIYHLFPSESQVRPIFFNLTTACKIISLLLVNILVSLLLEGAPNSAVLVFVSTLIAALALFMLSFGTKGGIRASLMFSTAIPFLLFIVSRNIPEESVMKILPLLVAETIMTGLWSFLPLILPARFSGKEARGRSNNIFPIMGMGCLFFLLGMIMKFIG